MLVFDSKILTIARFQKNKEQFSKVRLIHNMQHEIACSNLNQYGRVVFIYMKRVLLGS